MIGLKERPYEISNFYLYLYYKHLACKKMKSTRQQVIFPTIINCLKMIILKLVLWSLLNMFILHQKHISLN